jgi:hypothetical protein
MISELMLTVLVIDTTTAAATNKNAVIGSVTREESPKLKDPIIH